MISNHELKKIANVLVSLNKNESSILIDEIIKIILKSQMITLKKENNLNSEGIYIIFDSKHNEILYVGETGNLAKRHKDLFNSKNHSFRRKLGNELFKKSKFKPNQIYSNKDKFNIQIESKLSHIMENLKIIDFPLFIGRKEIEEKIISIEKNKSNRNIKFYNTREKRK